MATTGALPDPPPHALNSTTAIHGNKQTRDLNIRNEVIT
jgi:hypothetical protein